MHVRVCVCVCVCGVCVCLCCAQLLKYTAANIIHTVHYVVSIRDVPLHRLKYLDEASFASRSLRRARALSEKGRPVHITSNNSISETYTVTIVRAALHCTALHCTALHCTAALRSALQQ